MQYNTAAFSYSQLDVCKLSCLLLFTAFSDFTNTGHYYVLNSKSAHTRTITAFYGTKYKSLIQLPSSFLQSFFKIPHLPTDRVRFEELLHCHGKSLFCYGLFHLQPVAILISLSGLIISGSFSLPCNGQKEKWCFYFKEVYWQLCLGFPWVLKSMKLEDPCHESTVHEIIYFFFGGSIMWMPWWLFI